MDALNSVLQVLRLKPQIFHRWHRDAPWSNTFSITNAAVLYSVEQGTCWLHIEGSASPLQLITGDVIIISNCRRYELSSSMLPESISQADVSDTASAESQTSTVLIHSEFLPEQRMAYPLFSLLPPIIYIRNTDGKAVDWLATPLDFITSEAQTLYPGYETIISHLLDILFIMALRYWIAHHSAGDGGWLRALYHPQIGIALNRIHSEPAHTWTLATLAKTAHMSRSTFSAQFTAMVGESPMQYLSRWRMQLAANLLLDDANLTVEQIARHVGYASPYAFSKAFKRVVGNAPSIYRDNQSRSGDD